MFVARDLRAGYDRQVIVNQLPGSRVPYFMKSGHGPRSLFAGHVVTRLARAEDTGGLFDAAIWAAGRGAELPLHRHTKSNQAVMVLAGQLDLNLEGRTYRLGPFDFASIPAGTLHGHRAHGHHTRFLEWTTGGDGGKLPEALGVITEFCGIPAEIEALTANQQVCAASLDTAFENGAASDAPHVSTVPPAGATPYILESGEGERLIAGDQQFTFLAHQGNTGGEFISLTTRGPKGDRIPRHFHEKHTECFFCLEGAMTMWAFDEEIALGPGDFLHVPAGTIHAYRLDAPSNNFMGILAPGLFEPFFRALCDPYPGYDFPAKPWPFRFDRVIAKLPELDLRLVEGPPQR